MDILWLTTRWPFPPDSGGKLVTEGFLRGLAARGHRITLCVLLGPDHSRPTLTRPAWIAKVHVLFQKRPAHLLPFLNAKYPGSVAKYWNRRALSQLYEILSSETYDLVQLDHPHCLPYGAMLRTLGVRPIVLLLHNVPSRLWSQAAAVTPFPRAAFLRWQARRFREFEATSFSSVPDLTLTLSEADAHYVRALVPRVPIALVPPGIPLPPPKPHKEEPGTLAFVGMMEWYPNADGALWFLRETWPQVKAEMPQATLYLVGGHPSKVLRRRARLAPRTVVTGWVPEVRPYLQRAQIAIVPLRIGSGVRIKVLEAFSLGKAVVSTSIGAEGLAVIHGEHLRIADSPTDFAQSVLELLRDAAARKRLGQAARKWVAQHHRWEQAAARLEAAYLHILKSKGRREQPEEASR